MISQSVMESMSQTMCSTSIVDNNRLQLYRGQSQFPTDVFYLQQVVWLNYEECVLGSYYQCKQQLLYTIVQDKCEWCDTLSGWLSSLRVWWHLHRKIQWFNRALNLVINAVIWSNLNSPTDFSLVQIEITCSSTSLIPHDPHKKSTISIW